MYLKLLLKKLQTSTVPLPFKPETGKYFNKSTGAMETKVHLVKMDIYHKTMIRTYGYDYGVI